MPTDKMRNASIFLQGCVQVKIIQSHLTLWPHELYNPWNSPGQNTEVGSLSLLQGALSNPGMEPRSPVLQADSLPAEPQGKPKNTGVGSLSLLQGIFPDLGIEPGSPALQADSLPTELSGKPLGLCPGLDELKPGRKHRPGGSKLLQRAR